MICGKLRTFVVCSCVVFAGFICSAQTLFFSNLSTRDGLPSNVLSAVVQDNHGFIWIGTANGLARYDGYTFKTFKREENVNSLPGNEISCLLQKDDDVWVGTWQGLSKINTRSFKVTRVHLKENNVIRTLTADKAGNVWIGTANGLLKYGKDSTITHYNKENSNLSHNTVRCVYEDNDGTLWVGSYDKLNRLTPEGDKFSAFDLKGNYKRELKNNLILDIKPVIGRDSLLWVGTETGLCLFNKLSGRYIRYSRTNSGFSNDVIKNIYAGADGRLWLGTDFGLNIFNPVNNKTDVFFHNPQISYSVANNVVWQIFEDTGGVIWFVTSNGISKVNKHNTLFRYQQVTHRIQNQTIGNQVKALLVTRSGITWIATQHGVIRMDPQDNTQKLFNIESPPNERIILNNVFALEEDDIGRIWIGTAGGINVWDEQKNEMHSITANSANGLTSNYIARFTKGADGSFYVSAWEAGLFKIVSGFDKPEGMKFEYIGDFASQKITYALNALWAIQNNQLFRIGIDSYVARKIDAFTEAGNGRDIHTLYYAPKASIWAGSVNGLIEYKPNLDSAYFHHIITGNDIAFNNIISDSFGNIWAAAGNFIIKYNSASKKSEIFPFEKDLPLKSFYSNCSVVTASNEVLFGGDNGFISFNTDIKPNDYKPNVFITGMEVNNKPLVPSHGLNGKTTLLEDVSFTKQLTLDYSQRSITFNFASLHYWQPEINVLAYKLEGLDNDWKYVSGRENFAVYSNLMPGTYNLRIRGTNNYGIWSDKEASISIAIRPPLFLSRGFMIAYIVIGITGILVTMRIYAIRLKLKNEIRIARLEKEHAENINQAKQQFFTSISHELRTPISLIIPPIQQIIRRGTLDEDSKSLILLAEKNSQRLLRLINQILDFRKLEHENQTLKLTWFDLVPFTQELYTLFSDKAARNEIDFTFAPEVTACPIWADKEKMEIIIFNLLSNAFKFTPKKGKISLALITEESPVHQNGLAKISVSDSGIGIALEEQTKIFEQFYQAKDTRKIEDGSGIGLTLVSEYTKLHRGEIKLKSVKGEGSTFSVLFPLGAAHFPIATTDKDTPVELVATRPAEDEHYKFNLRSKKPPILVVEDNIDMIDFITVSLKSKYDFITAENGEIAFDKVHHMMPEIIISDIMMPVMDGLSLCRKIKQDAKTSHIPIILLTAKSLTAQKIEGIKMGADIYITKPFEIELLEAHIDHLLERQTELALYFRNELITQPTSETGKENEDDRFLKKVMNTIEANISNPEFSVEQLSEDIGMSSTHLYRKLKSLTNLSANEIIKKYRLKKASLLLKNKEGNISEIMYEVGFSNLSYFSKCFKNEFGLTPKEYQLRQSKHSFDLKENLNAE